MKHTDQSACSQAGARVSGWWTLVALAAMGLSSCDMFLGDFEIASNTGAERPDASPAVAADAAGQTTLPDATPSLPSSDAAPQSACAPFPAHRCVEGVLQACSLDETGARVYSDQQTCGEQARCDAVSGKCLACIPGSFRCSGEELEQCDGSGWLLEQDCEQSQLRCDATLGDCTACLLNDDRCDGEDRLTKCVLGQQGRELVTVSCDGFACLSRESGADYCQQCGVEGATHCLAETSGGPPTTLVTCGADLRYRTIPCAAGSLCEVVDEDSARCVD